MILHISTPFFLLSIRNWTGHPDNEPYHPPVVSYRVNITYHYIYRIILYVPHNMTHSESPTSLSPDTIDSRNNSPSVSFPAGLSNKNWILCLAKTRKLNEIQRLQVFSSTVCVIFHLMMPPTDIQKQKKHSNLIS